MVLVFSQIQKKKIETIKENKQTKKETKKRRKVRNKS